MLRMSEVNEVDHQAMQHLLTESCADWQGFGQQIAQEANELLGGKDAVLIFDESGFTLKGTSAKKGAASAGVARQWNGRLGKVDNGQVGVFAALCRGDMATLIDTRLYCRRTGVTMTSVARKPRYRRLNGRFKANRSLALAMLKIARQRGIQFGYVGIDGGYGKEPAFLRDVDEQGCRFVADVHCDQMIYAQDPEPQVPEWSGRGRQPRHRKPQSAGQRVDQWAAAQPSDAGRRLTLREGEKGLLVADYLHTLVWLWDGEEEQARCWHLWVRREAGANGISHYCLSNAPLDTTWQELARVKAQRFFIEPSFREAKSECGIPTGHKWPTTKSVAGMPGTCALWVSSYGISDAGNAISG